MTYHSPLATSDELLAYIPPADLDDAYENSAYIPGATSWLQSLPDRTASFRASQPDAMLNQPYGKSERQRYDRRKAALMPQGACWRLCMAATGWRCRKMIFHISPPDRWREAGRWP